jgi:hypothetical protein
MAGTGAAAGEATDPAVLALAERRWGDAVLVAGVRAGCRPRCARVSAYSRGVWREYAAARQVTRTPMSYPVRRAKILRAALRGVVARGGREPHRRY